MGWYFMIGWYAIGGECPLSNESLNKRNDEMSVTSFRKRVSEMSIPKVLASKW
jgi:hypothetical protein